MPAIYAHMRFGEAVNATLPPSFSEITEKYPEAFCLGTQGADILFYHKPLRSNPIKKKGSDVHHTSADGFFATQAKRLIEENKALGKAENDLPDSAFAAYLMGFLCHFTLDVYCHPKIYELEATGVSHGRIESEFDKYFLKKDGKPIRGYNVGMHMHPDNGTAEACAKTLDVTEEQSRLSIKTMRKINGWFSCKCEAFHMLAHVVLKIVKMENKFGGMFLHKKDEPHCTQLNPILEERWTAAIDRAATLIQGYFTSLPEIANNGEMDEFFRNNYTGGPI